MSPQLNKTLTVYRSKTVPTALRSLQTSQGLHDACMQKRLPKSDQRLSRGDGGLSCGRVDPQKVADRDIKKLKPVHIVVDGKVVYDAIR
jgi:hypothetical protein